VRAVGPAGSIVLFDSNLCTRRREPDRPATPALTLGFTRPFIKQLLDYPRRSIRARRLVLAGVRQLLATTRAFPPRSTTGTNRRRSACTSANRADVVRATTTRNTRRPSRYAYQFDACCAVHHASARSVPASGKALEMAATRRRDGADRGAIRRCDRRRGVRRAGRGGQRAARPTREVHARRSRPSRFRLATTPSFSSTRSSTWTIR